jgi:hypothetical protein
VLCVNLHCARSTHAHEDECDFDHDDDDDEEEEEEHDGDHEGEEHDEHHHDFSPDDFRPILGLKMPMYRKSGRDFLIVVFLPLSEAPWQEEGKNDLDHRLCLHNEARFHQDILLSQVVAHTLDREVSVKGIHLTFGFIVMNVCNIAKGIDQYLYAIQTLVEFDECLSSSKCYHCKTDHFHAGRLIAAVSHTSNQNIVPLAGLVTVLKTPLIATIASSDIFDVRSRFPYILRLIKHSSEETQCIIKLITHFKWYSIIVLYTSDVGAEDAFVRMKAATLTGNDAWCLALSYKVPGIMEDNDTRQIVDTLLKQPASTRVIVGFLRGYQVRKIINGLLNNASRDRFIWVFPHKADNLKFTSTSTLIGSIVITPLKKNKPIPDELSNFIRTRTLENTRGDPWFQAMFQKLCNCTKAACNRSLPVEDCANKVPPSSPSYIDILSSSYIDIVSTGLSTAINATERVLNSDVCANAITKHDFYACVNRSEIRQQIINDLESKENVYFIYQVTVVTGSRDAKLSYVAKYSPKEGRISEGEVNFSWPNNTEPRSFCSLDCKLHQKKVRQTNPCCWDCVDCKENEIVVKSECQPCPEFKWPSSERNGLCEKIPVTVPTLSIPKTVFAALFFALCMFVAGYFHKYNHTKVIKASSRPLSLMMLSGCLLGDVTVVLSMASPSDSACAVFILSYATCLALLYAPLMIRTLLIYRIFVVRIRTAQHASGWRSTNMVFLSLAVVLIMTIVCCLGLMSQSVWTKPFQPRPGKKYVEQACFVDNVLLVTILAFSAALLLISAVLAFQMRHLPDNFNEAGFIASSACTSLTILVCFSSIYNFVPPGKASEEIMILALMINQSLTLCLLFIPKIYAVHFMELMGGKSEYFLSSNYFQRSRYEMSEINDMNKTGPLVVVKIIDGGSKQMSKNFSTSISNRSLRGQSICTAPVPGSKSPNASIKDVKSEGDALVSNGGGGSETPSVDSRQLGSDMGDVSNDSVSLSSESFVAVSELFINIADMNLTSDGGSVATKFTPSIDSRDQSDYVVDDAMSNAESRSGSD